MGREFDKNFLAEQILMARKKLNDDNLVGNEKIYLEIMIDKFNEYLERKKTVILDDDEYILDRNSYKELNDKLKKDLELIGIEFWKNIIYLYNNTDHSTFEEKNYNNISIEQEEFFDIILDFYEKIDYEYYKKALQIIQCPISLINFGNNVITGDECFSCEPLKLPFINISSIYDDKYIAFVHELQHGINYLVKGSPTYGLLNELAPIFFETLFIDFLNGKNKCEGLYSIRINNNINTLEWLNSYAKILLRFDKCGRKVTKYNIKRIFDVNNKEQLKIKCEKYKKIDFIKRCCYMLSFFMCIELRENYYNGNKEEVLKTLKDVTRGKYGDVNFNALVNSYNDYIEEVKEKQKKYQKIVNL